MNRGKTMIRKFLIVGSALVAVASFGLISAPAEAGGCTVVVAKARGLDQSDVGKRSAKHLTHKVNHWAHKNGLKAVRMSPVSTACGKKGLLAVCTSSAKVCP
jgi:hypothetical protein